MQTVPQAISVQPLDSRALDHVPSGQGFVDLVDFKWLMAGVGWWVNLSRLQKDAAYAHDCLQRALCSGLPLLRERGAALLGQPRALIALAA